MSDAESPDPRGAITAAEIAVSREDYARAEDALLAALSEVRKEQAGEHDE